MADQGRWTLLLTLVLSLWTNSGDSYFFSDQCDDICPAVHYSSTYDIPCITNCDKQGYDYYWCRTKSGWDYCSPGINIDYYGGECLASHPCGKYLNNDDNRCVSAFSRALIPCGRVEPKAVIEYSIYLKECISECEYDERGEFFWCYTADKWDYCSPRPDVTYKNVPCRSDSKCATRGETYSWCYTTSNNHWDYCGIISSGECSYTDSSRRKRQPNQSRVICTREDQNTRIVTEFREQPGRSEMANINSRLRTEARNLINRFDGQGLSDQSRSNLIHSDNFRIDNQGACTIDNRRCYNLQVQRNIPRNQGRSTTVAHILIPIDAPTDYMHLALRESLDREVSVVVDVKDQPVPSTSGGNKKCCKRRKK